jgi:hypothetical protein
MAVMTRLEKRTAYWKKLAYRNHTQQGQAAVEIALVLPLLLLVLSGIIIVAFIFYAHIQVSNAVREGARAGSVYWDTHPSSGLSLQDTVRKAVYDPGTGTSALGFLPPTGSSFNVNNDVTISLLKPDNTAGNVADPRPGDRLTVSIVYSYTVPIVSVALPMFRQPLVMRSNVMMEIQ